MSTHQSVIIICDGIDSVSGDECDEVFRPGPDTGPTAQHVRRKAATIGWRVGLPGGRDLCPHDHVPDGDQEGGERG